MQIVKHTDCPSCKSNETKYIGKIPPNNAFAGRILDRVLDGGDLFACRQCHLAFRNPRLTKTELDRLYRLGDSESWSTTKVERADWFLVKNWVRERKGVKRILDVGCFDGRMLDFLGDQYDRFGVEIHSEAAERARQRKVNVVAENFDQLSDLHILVDVVLAVDIIEHVEDPMALLKALASCVHSGGYILLTSGNSNAPTWKLMGSNYWYCHICEHISFINPKWVAIAAKQIGFNIETLKRFAHLENNRSLKQMFHETSSNLLLRFFPKVFAELRNKGFGGIDVRKYPQMAQTPPYWMSARDHIMIALKKPCAY